MAVMIQYIVVRNGVQKMTFTSKKEADAYDRQLDIAEELQTFISSSKIQLNEETLEELALFLAENGPKVMDILRGQKPKPAPPREEGETAPRKSAGGRKKPA